MALVHHNDLRVNAEVADSTVDHYRELGWKSGKHKDTDPEDYSPVPRVLPLLDPPSDDPDPVKATPKTDPKKEA